MKLVILKNIRYPYDGDKPCFWNLALIIRIQVQLIKTLRDKISRLIAAAESQFQSFFVNEVLRAEILPLVRSSLNDPRFLAAASGKEVEESSNITNDEEYINNDGLAMQDNEEESDMAFDSDSNDQTSEDDEFEEW